MHVSALLACICVPSFVHAADQISTSWQPYRDANPFVAASGLPFVPPSASPDSWRVDAIASASNTELAFDRDAEHLVYDAEIHEIRVFVTRAFGEHWIARATIGETSFGNGFLDSFLEDYHRAFGFSAGDRGRLGTDGHTIAYSDGRGPGVLLDRTLHAVTPALLDVAYRRSDEGHEWLYGATLKLPTSNASPLVDDRAVDVSGWVAVQSTDPLSRVPWGARVGVMQRGNSRLLSDRVNDTVPFADAKVGFSLLPGWEVAAQLQWHSALYESDIPFLQSAATLAVSSAWHARTGWTLRAGLVEDAVPRHSQDVTFFVGLSL
ncbi:MAG: DUF3187 family protein [Dokdonella sp.]|uniref:DUF3187 family protein n=1 Tax=Dokdonella sp. TaxID=2291710 RepID=UPI003264CA08